MNKKITREEVKDAVASILCCDGKSIDEAYEFGCAVADELGLDSPKDCEKGAMEKLAEDLLLGCVNGR